MKYRHAYHAGNFADVLKHVVLIEILKSLARKPAPFCYLETHAGRGAYPLSAEPRPGSEFSAGFGRLLEQTNLPAPLNEYTALVKRLGSDPASNVLQFYPGSPLIAAALLRPDDRAVLFEIQSAEALVLQETLRPYRNTTVHHGDGYGAVRSQLPPRERRGLVLIDPSYELQEKEFPLALHALREAHGRWPTGIFALWYPIKQRSAVVRFHAELKQTDIRRILCAELCVFPDDSRVSLNGCGMIVINPPWQLDQTLAGTLPVLHRLLGAQPSTSTVCSWLVPE